MRTRSAICKVRLHILVIMPPLRGSVQPSLYFLLPRRELLLKYSNRCRFIPTYPKLKNKATRVAAPPNRRCSYPALRKSSMPSSRPPFREKSVEKVRINVRRRLEIRAC